MNTREQIILNEDRLLTAIKNGDIEDLDQLLHEDLLFNLPNGVTITKAMDMETYISGNLVVNSILPAEQQINLINDTAVVSVKIELKAVYTSQSIEGIFRYLRVWKLFDQEWKVIAGSCVAI
ncbi:nuclear transport factor 2 family protein [Pedobacter sp. ISL-68]|uniref:nuclear transport factor 2 family protein n=1 Tax=unclassified Pedobacter TaxID=2628915 RepID=UPI001BEBE778|nr:MULTISPECIES: nuclear transport factor 2 family protein [unclassified Pedobacter]MBT2561142.1 nuclear transport factor 2 family protein [Pedobacter sp. ISL-64]MBT2590531.1 nuclear transport factor 2 family protein [Pedobacter sp. ISL-68]